MLRSVKLSWKIFGFLAVCLLSFGAAFGLEISTSLLQSQPQNLISQNLKSQAQNRQFYISPDGDDLNLGTINQPFRTIQRAKREVRKFNKTMTADIVVNLKTGTYFINNATEKEMDNQVENTFRFDESDQGNNGFQVIYQSFSSENLDKNPAERATISGGKELKNWQLSDPNQNIYRAFLGKSVYPRQFYVNGERAIRARGADYPAKFLKTKTGFDFADADFPYANLNSWQNQTDLEFVSLYNWTVARCHPVSISDKSIVLQSNCFDENSWSNGISWIENAYELLDSPGEWYFNRADGYLYYKPKITEDITKIKAKVAVQEKLLDVQSNNIQFKNLNFEYGTWFEPNTSDGYKIVQTGFRIKKIAGATTAESSPGNIQIQHAQNITFSGNLFQHLGAIALDFRSGAQNINILANKFEDISGAAIQLGYNLDQNPVKTNQVQNIKIKNNYIARVAQEFFDHAGINFFYAGNINIDHNEITDLPYIGISLGNPALDPCTSTQAQNNRISNNFIHNSMNKLVDGGAIYVNSWQPNSEISGNYLFETYSTTNLYFDDGARGFNAKNNAIVSNSLDIPWARSISATNFENNVSENFYSQAQEYVDKSTGNYDALRKTIVKCKVGLSPNQSKTNYVNNLEFALNKIPEKAQDIINKSGIEPNFKYVKNLNDQEHLNLAFNKKVSSSSESNKFFGNPERAVDNSFTSKFGWASAVGDRNPWYQIDLGSAQIINEFEIAFNNQESQNIFINSNQPQTRSNFEIRGSNNSDFRNSTLLYKYKNLPISYRFKLNKIINNNQSFRYIRVVKTNHNLLAIFEIKLFSNPKKNLTFEPLEIDRGLCVQSDLNITNEAIKSLKVDCVFPVKSNFSQVLRAGYFIKNTKITSENCVVNSSKYLVCPNLPISNSADFGSKSIFLESNNFIWHDRAQLEIQPFIISQGECERNSEFPAFVNNKSVAYLGQKVACRFPIQFGSGPINEQINPKINPQNNQQLNEKNIKIKAGYHTLFGFLAADCVVDSSDISQNKKTLTCPAITIAHNQFGQKYIDIQASGYTWRQKATITIKPIFDIKSGACAPASEKNSEKNSGKIAEKNSAIIGEKVDCVFALTGNPAGVGYVLPLPNPDYPQNRKSLFAQYTEGDVPQISDPCLISGNNLICRNLPTNNVAAGEKVIDIVHFGTTTWSAVNILTVKASN